MKKVTILLITALMAFGFNGLGQTTIWLEDFNNPADDGVGATGPIPVGTNTGVTSPTSGKWSVDVSNCNLSATSDWFRVQNQLFEARDVDGTQQSSGSGDGAIWTSESIDISGFTNVIISVDISENGTLEDQDFIKASYQIDGGTITVFGHVYDDFADQTFQITGLSGSSLIVYVEADNNSGSEYIRFDNVLVQGTSGGNNPPSITNINQTPSSDITSTTTVSVSADVTDSDGTVSLVELHWGTASGILTNTINMSNTGGDSYTTDTDIPAQANGTTVYYEVYAEDDLGDDSSSPEYNYTVNDPATTTIPYSETFDADLGDCYTYSVSGATKFWVYDSYGGNGFAEMNGYDSGDTEEDWLVLPGINFDSYSNEIMSFDTWWQYGSDDVNNYLKLYYSADYPGIGDPLFSTGYTWTELSYTQGASQIWTSSGYIDLSGLSGTSVYIAFKYHYEVGNYRHWEIDNISIFESVPVNVTFQVNMVEQTVSGDGVHVAGSFNGWDPTATEMLDGDLDNVYTVTLSLNSNIEYQFKYINGNAWGSEETVPAECQAPGTTNRYEVVSSPDYSIDVVCFSSCEDCGVLNDYDITFQVDMKNETVSGDGVFLAGDFNGWGGTLMTATGSVWSTTVTLQEGSYHEFKFVNGNPGAGGTWESFNGTCVVWDGGNRFMTTPTENTILDLVCFNSCDACPVADFVIINEVDADDVLTDDLEFIELYDGGIGNTDLSGLVVVLFNGSDDASYLPVADLDGYSTDADGYFVIGNALVPNVDLVMSNGFLQNGADAVALFIGNGVDFPDNTPVTTTNLLDALVYDTNDADDPGLLVLLNAGQPQVNEGGRGNKDEHSNQRIPNGSGGQRNTYTYDQSLPTPGAVNVLLFTDWTGQLNSNWEEAGNWHNGIPNAGLGATIPDVSKAPFPAITGSATCNSLFIYAGASLEIGTTGSLTVNGTFTNNGTLTVKSDATGTGSLIESSGVNATVERYYTGGQWHFISSPISDATANMFLGLYLQYHTESTNQYTDITDPGAGLNVMQGYALWNNINATAQFIGTLNTGSYGSANNLTRSGTPPPPEDTLGWNLMGNPYPSSIDWNASPGWTKTNVNATIYIEASGNWATWNGTAGTNGGTQYIAPGQGYFVEVTANQSLGTLICDNSVRIHNPTTFFKNTVNNIVKLLAEGNGKTDETVILFDEDATEEFDGNYDAHKFFAYDVSYPQIYSIADKNIAINTLPETEWVQLGFKAGISGEYTISATEINDISSAWLEDTFTGVFTNLTIDSYSFTYTVDDNEARFIVHFTPLAVDENTEDIFNIYSYGNEVYVSVPENTKGNIVICNIMGQEVINAPIHNVLNKITLEKSAYYLVKVLSNESMVTKKVFIK